ncbi:MAG TPA: helix-turn-helix domain-containing protein [Solirubrobacter sp.]|nr:helix-turn-helix domain-containing protein [Solirubrobacter sp.]
MRVEFDDDDIDRLAARVAAKLQQPQRTSPWLTAPEAAEYLRCSLSRVRKLTMLGDLPCHKDGSRVLYRIEELDSFVGSGGASANTTSQ